MKEEVPVNLFSLNKLEGGKGLNEEGNGEDKLGFPAWDFLAIGEQFASSVFDILDELHEERTTCWKGL
jgi:hypothetical protein